MPLFTQEQASQMKSILTARWHATQAKRFNCHLSGCLVLRRPRRSPRPLHGGLWCSRLIRAVWKRITEICWQIKHRALPFCSLSLYNEGPESRKDISPVKLPPCNWVVCVSWQLRRQPNTFPYDSHCDVLTPNKKRGNGKAFDEHVSGYPFFHRLSLSLSLGLCLSPQPLCSRQQQSPKAVGNDVESS